MIGERKGLGWVYGVFTTEGTEDTEKNTRGAEKSTGRSACATEMVSGGGSGAGG
jgi:hypothetical protein